MNGDVLMQAVAMPAPVNAMGAPDGALVPVLAGAEPTPPVATATGAPAVAVTASLEAPQTAPSEQPTSLPPASAPVAIQLAPAPTTVGDGSVDIQPMEAEIAPDAAGPVGQAMVTLTNRDGGTAQVVWMSAEQADLLAMEVDLAQPHIATLTLRVDLAQAAALGSQAPVSARLYAMTSAGTTTVRVTWRPLPYGSM